MILSEYQQKSVGFKNESPLAETPTGPILGPSYSIHEENPLLDGDFTPQSPYSANQGALRDMTLPTAPNYDIPPSPPGSPVPSTKSKFKHFLDLKKKDVHFNEKLANSAALKNPSLMQKLMDFADIDEASQYATTLDKELWSPGSFPESAYKEGLSKIQQQILKKRDEKNRGSFNFVPATSSIESSRSDTSKPGQKSTAERIMAGLDRGRSNSPRVQGTKRKTRFEV